MGDEISRTNPISDPSSQSRRPEEEKREPRPKRPRPIPRDLNDVASILGIPAKKITPGVNQAILSLLEEVDRLRDEAEIHHGRISFLEELAHQHSFLPILNRRSFEIEIGRILARDERTHMGASLVIFDIKGATQLKESLGISVGETALLHAVNIILNALRQSDVIGFIGWSYIGVILTQASEEAARNKAAQLAKAITETPFQWRGNVFFLETTYVLNSFTPVKNPRELIYNIGAQFRL